MTEDIQDDHVERIRSAGEVARRCIVLYAVIVGGHEDPSQDLVRWLEEEKLWDWVTPVETAFLQSDSPTQQQRVNATWRAEAMVPLLWALGLVPDLPPPTGLCDVQALRGVLPPLMSSVVEWLSAARLRPDAALLAANEEIYQIHWRVRDAQLRDRPTPPGKLARMPVPDCEPPVEFFHPGVVQERHHALHWLIGYRKQDWDDISTDT